MAIVKSKLLKQLSKSFPNVLKKYLEKFIDIVYCAWARDEPRYDSNWKKILSFYSDFSIPKLRNAKLVNFSWIQKVIGNLE